MARYEIYVQVYKYVCVEGYCHWRLDAINRFFVSQGCMQLVKTRYPRRK